jgi:hypothetical protein
LNVQQDTLRLLATAAYISLVQPSFAGGLRNNVNEEKGSLAL